MNIGTALIAVTRNQAKALESREPESPELSVSESPSMVDELLRFQAEAGRVIAGCAFESPLMVLELLDLLLPAESLIDQRAIRFIKALQERRSDLEKAETIADEIEIAGECAGEDLPLIGLAWLQWVPDGDLLKVAKEAVADVREIPIVIRGVTRLARYMASEQQFQYEQWHKDPPAPRKVRIG